MYDPLLNNSSDQQWAPPVPEGAKDTHATKSQPRTSVDRRAMLEQLKAQRQAGVSTSETPADVPVTSRTTKKSPRPARAAKILVFGLSTTAMFGAVTGYALADIQQHQKSVPVQPVMPAAAPAATSTGTVGSASQGQPVTPGTTPAAPTKKVAKTQPVNDPAAAPTATSPIGATPAETATAAPTSANNAVVDIPVPQAAQPGQGQSSGGKQQSSGSH